MMNAATALPWQTLLDANLMKRHDRVPAVGCLIIELVTYENHISRGNTSVIMYLSVLR